MALQTGDLLHGRYRILEPLGVGGMGSVWSAEDELTRATRVVKHLHVDASDLLAAFRGEYALLSRLSHPHLVRVLDFGTAHVRGELVHYYAAERVEGRTLAEHAARPRLGPAELLRPILDALEGLAVLHQARLRHGDFTPSNVLVRPDGSGVLIDLGLTRPFGVTDAVGGTVGYLAPELLRNATGDARADVFAVGSTLQRCFDLAGSSPSTEVARVIDRACREDAARRPADARELLEALGRRDQLADQVLAPIELVGRDPELRAFEAWLHPVRELRSGPRVLCVAGAAGMGISRLMQELLWRCQLALPTLRTLASESASVGRLLASALEQESPVQSVSGVLAALPALGARSEPLVLFVEDHERLEPREHELLTALARLLPDTGPLALVISGQVAVPGIPSQVIDVGPLSLAALRRWTSGLLSEERLLALQRLSGGAPARFEAALRDVDGSARSREVRAPDEHARRAIFSLSPALRAALAQVSVLGAESIADARYTSSGDLESLFATGLIGREGERVRLRHDTAIAIEHGALSESEISRAHLKAAEWRLASEASPTEPVLRFALAIEHYALAGDLTRAQNLFDELHNELQSEARTCAKPLLALARRSEQSDLLLRLSGLLLAGGFPRAALSAASRAMRRKPSAEQRLRATTLASDALVRLGRPARAELLLGRLLAKSARAGEPELVERLARARLSRADYQGAARTAEEALTDATKPELEGRLRETIGVAMAYLGDLERAELELGAAWSLLAQSATPRERCRIQSHRATVAFRAGRIEPALANYAGALALAEQERLDDLVASGLLNLGTAEQQSGAWASALAHYRRGALFARAIGRETTELTLEFNLANLYAELGAFERAEERLSALERRASGARLAHFAPAMLLVRAEIRLALADPQAAEHLLERASELARERAQPRELFEIGLRRAETALLRQELASAAERLDTLRQASDEPSLGELRFAWCALEARLSLAQGETPPLSELEAGRREAEREGLLPLQATLETTLFELLEARAEPDAARVHGERARRLWDRISADLPEAFASSFWTHPRRARVAELSRAVLPHATAHSTDAEPYRRLLSLNRRLNSSLSVARILEYALQSAVELTGAERGFLLHGLDGPAGADTPAEPRYSVRLQSDPLANDADGPSQSIVRRTFERQEPIMTTDAQGDPRFRGQGSVHALRLKSVLSVPILSPSGTLGVLYVDSRVQRARFSAADRDLLLAFADQLALALSNANLHAELERKSAEILQQKLEVERLARGQAREIVRLKREVETQRKSLELRYDYAQIVGRGPAMRAVLERLDRVTESEVNVLVLGESGTGKELVARALHFNGPRKAGAFLGINCAALPENLLESELFGHVRGAFTGADRDKLGLMQAANGGTLFLDEVGELPLATQAKLLRVLQEREVRPLGATRAQPLDIRLVAATHRDLPSNIAQGTFREDLYYRIAVVSVELPPLRDRLEDLPALSSRILEGLARDAGRPPQELSRDALRKLSGHRFPGNVRELQNVLTRAFVLATGPRLTADDIELAVSARKRVGNALSRKDFEAQERQRILEALRQARWNVSVVARSLGIPRNTLYRKLTRYGLNREPPSAG